MWSVVATGGAADGLPVSVAGAFASGVEGQGVGSRGNRSSACAEHAAAIRTATSVIIRIISSAFHDGFPTPFSLEFQFVALKRFTAQSPPRRTFISRCA